MARYVDLDKVTVWRCPHNIAQMREWAFGLPMEDVKPVVHAHWEMYRDENNITYGYHACSNCKTIVGIINYEYCPYCGAKMDEEVQS